MFVIRLNKNRNRMNCERSIGLSIKKCLMTLVLLTSLMSISYAQTITINKQLFVGGNYRDSSNITVPIDIDVNGTNGFGYDTSAAFKRFNNNIFVMVLVPAANANAVFTDTIASINLAGAKIIGRYRFSNDQVPYTTYVNGIVPPLGVGTNTANYVIRVISTRPFISSDASPIFTVKRPSPLAAKVKSYAVPGAVGNTTAIYYDGTHSSMFFGYCGTIVDKFGNATDTSISLLDSTAGNFNTPSSYDSVILINNSFHGLVNTDAVVFRAKYTAKGSINFPSKILKSGEYYTVLLKAFDDSGYVSSKSYFLLNTLWNFNIQKSSKSSNGCKGDTVTLFPLINNVQLGQQFGLLDNFPGLLYNVNWGDPKAATPINYTYNELISNGGLFVHKYDTTSCYRPIGSQFWSINARLVNPFTGNNCSFPLATSTVQIFASVKAKFIHHAPVCLYNALDTIPVVIKDSSYAGSNINCTGSAYYTWYKTFVGCGSIKDTAANPFTPVDSSANQVNGIYVPTAVGHYDHKDTFQRVGVYIFKIVADNKSCNTDGYVDSIMVVAPPKANFKIDSSGILKDTISGCSPLTVKVTNLSDSTCSQKWSFKWEVIDTTTKAVVPPGTIYKIPAPYKNTDTAPNIVFYKQGVYKVRLIGSNACTKADTAYKLVTVIGNGGVTFPSGNKITANNFETNAYCLYLTPSKTVNFDSAVRIPAIDTTMKPLYGGTASVTTPYNWEVTDIAGTHKYNLPTDSTKKYPSVTFTTPPSKDGDFMVKVTYSSTCGTSTDSFELILNRQVVPKIIEPTKDTSICPNSGCLQFTGTATAADGTNSGYTSLQWIDQSSSSLFGNGLVASLCNINSTRIVSFKAIKAQPNACPDTTVTRKITVLANPSGRDTTFSICSGTKLNYNPATTSTAGNTYTWNSIVTVGSVTGNTSCSSSCTNIPDVLNGDGTACQVIYIITPIGANGCPGTPFQVIVNILPYPTIAHSVVKDTLCSGALSNIVISTNTSGAQYNWSIAYQGALQPYGTWPAYTNQLPTISNGVNSGNPLNIAYINNGLTVDSFRVLFTVSVAGGTCSSPTDSITMYVIPGPTQPKANTPSDSIYLCNQGSVTLNATVPNLIKGEQGKWTPINTPPQVVIPVPDSTKPNATVFVAPGNVYQMQWSISSPLATAFGCSSLSDVVTIFNRPNNTVANVGLDTTICNYAGAFVFVPLKGNSNLNPWEIGTWTVIKPNPAISDSLKSTSLDSSHKYNDIYIFRGGTGEYDLVWTIRNDANCPVAFDTLKIGAGFGNNSIAKDTVLCNGQSIAGLTGSLPQGGGGSYVYQWFTGIPSSGTLIPGATSQDYTPAGGLKPGTTTQYYRTTSSVNCPTAKLPSNTVTVSVNQSPKAGFITTLDTSCAPFKLDTTVIKLDELNFPVDTSCTYTWYVNGVLVANGPKFSVNGLYTIANPGDVAVVELRDSSKRGCGNVLVLQHTFYTRIKPTPTFNTSTGLWTSCNPSDFTFINTTVNPGLYDGWDWKFGEGDVANTQNPPLSSYHYVDLVGKDTVYNVCLSAWTACHDTVKYCKTITIQSKPHASFYASSYNGCAPLKTTFFNTTLGIVDSSKWYWYYPANMLDTSIIDNRVIPVNTPLPHSFPYTADVMLKVYNKCGVDSTTPIHFQVAFTAVNVKLGLSYNDQYACTPHTSNQIYNAIGADKVEIWTYPVGGSPNATPNYSGPVTAGIYPFTFTDTGKHVIKVTGSNFCDSMTVYDTVTMFVTPFPQFNLVKDTFCVGDTVWPINKTTTPNVSYSWVFSTMGKTLPNPATSGAQSPYVVFTNPGADSIALGTTISYPFPSPGYCADTTKRPVFVVTTQRANFTISNSTPSCIPATVTFTNNSPSNGFPPTSWHFNYPNANPSATANNTPSYTYQDTGTYIVVLDTKSQGGCLYTDTQKVVVSSPFAQVWKYDHGFICGATPVSYQVMNPNKAVDSIFLWHFGDGTPAVATPWNTPNVFHSYRNCGIYYPSVDLIAKGGCKYTLNWNTGDTIKVDSVKADFAYVINKNCGNTVLSFTDASNACFGKASWDWNFGDIGLPSNFSTLQNPSHTYKVSDIDTVQLKVTGVSGCTNTYQLPINIKVNSVPQITSHVINPFNGVTACTGQTVTYSGTATSIDPIKDYVWTFSNAPTFNGVKVTNAYPAVGTYLDTLTVSTIFGCTAQFFGSVNVFQTPTIAIAQTNPPEICRGVPYPLSATTTDPGTTIFLWGPAGGAGNPNANIVCTNGNCSTVTVSPLSSTQIYVQGLASNGCTGYGDTIRVNVIQPITLTVTPARDTICIGDSVQLNTVAVGATTYAWDVDSSLHYHGTFNDSVANPIAHPVHIGDNVYTVRATNGCFKDSGIVHILVGGYPIISLGNPGYDTIIVQTGSTLPMSNYVHLSPDTFKTYVWTPSTGLNCNNCPDPVVTVAGNQLYTLKATTVYGCSDTDYMYIKTFCQNSQVYIPNAFTPDGDGRNDVLMVRGSGIKIVKNFRIYNRWGQVVFERANFNVNDPQFGWNGKVRNTNEFSPPDVYVYYCEVLCDDDVAFTYQGNITLVK